MSGRSVGWCTIAPFAVCSTTSCCLLLLLCVVDAGGCVVVVVVAAGVVDDEDDDDTLTAESKDCDAGNWCLLFCDELPSDLLELAADSAASKTSSAALLSFRDDKK